MQRRAGGGGGGVAATGIRLRWLVVLFFVGILLGMLPSNSGEKVDAPAAHPPRHTSASEPSDADVEEPPVTHPPKRRVVRRPRVTEAPSADESTPAPADENSEPATEPPVKRTRRAERIARLKARAEKLDKDCKATKETFPALEAVVARRGIAASDGSKCVAGIEPVQAFLPFFSGGTHARCATDNRGWATVADHHAAMDWLAVQSRRKAARLLLAFCHRARQAPTVLHAYFDIGSRSYDHSVEWFMNNYPDADKFAVHAYDPDPAVGASFDAKGRGAWFENAMPWTEQGWVTQLVVPLPTNAPGEKGPKDLTPDDDALPYLLNERLLPTVFHHHVKSLNESALREMAEHMDDPTVAAYPRVRRTVRTISIAGLILSNVKPHDFVVLRLDAQGYEVELLASLIEHGAMHLIDEVFLVCRNRELNVMWNGPRTPLDCQRIVNTLRKRGVYVHEWLLDQ